MIALGKRAETFYDKQAEQAMFAFANQVAVALVNADLFEETAARTERLSLLNRVSIALAQSLDTENIMEIALREIAQLLRHRTGARLHLRARYQRGARRRRISARRRPAEQHHRPARQRGVRTRHAHVRAAGDRGCGTAYEAVMKLFGRKFSGQTFSAYVRHAADGWRSGERRAGTGSLQRARASSSRKSSNFRRSSPTRRRLPC